MRSPDSAGIAAMCFILLASFILAAAVLPELWVMP